MTTTQELAPAADSCQDMRDLIAIMAALRTPETGCPWDLVQTFRTIAPYTIEEAYEVADAIERDDMIELVDELGDLLLQVVFHARLAEEAGHFSFVDVVRAINAKMVRRHPHVFGDETTRSAGAAKESWNKIKALEKEQAAARKAALGQAPRQHGLLDSVPTSLPALTRAVKLQATASSVGFDWNDPRAVLAKIREELDEFEASLSESVARQQEEWGDIVFALANLARHQNFDAEGALRGTNQKFIRRFAFIEASLAAIGRSPADASLGEMDALWNAAKAEEDAGGFLR